MLRPCFRISKGGFVASGVFLSLAVAVFLWVFFIASRNPADSGESGLLLLPFALPWIMLVPVQWLGPISGIGMIFFNALILYLVFGGMRFERGLGDDDR